MEYKFDGEYTTQAAAKTAVQSSGLPNFAVTLLTQGISQAYQAEPTANGVSITFYMSVYVNAGDPSTQLIRAKIVPVVFTA